MKEIKYVFVGKAKDFNAFNITVQTVKKLNKKADKECFKFIKGDK